MTKKKASKKVSIKKAPVMVKRVSSKTIGAEPVLDTTGTVVVRSVDEVEPVSEGKAMSLKPVVDKDTGVLTMVPVEDND